MSKYHQWDSCTQEKEGLGQPDGLLLPVPPLVLHKTLQYLSGQCPLKGGTLPHTPVLPSGTMANPLLTSVTTPSPRTTQSPGS